MPAGNGARRGRRDANQVTAGSPRRRGSERALACNVTPAFNASVRLTLHGRLAERRPLARTKVAKLKREARTVCPASIPASKYVALGVGRGHQTATAPARRFQGGTRQRRTCHICNPASNLACRGAGRRCHGDDKNEYQAPGLQGHAVRSTRGDGPRIWVTLEPSSRNVRTRLAAIIVCLALTLTAAHARQVQIALLTAAPFESYLESLRLQTGVPAISGTILQDGQVIWERGLGFQNQEARIRATPDTPYPIGDLSQTIAAVLLLQCTEQRRVDVADSARRYGIGLPEPTATLRHILSHTSAGTPRRRRHDPIATRSCRPRPSLHPAAILQDRRGQRARTAGYERLGSRTRSGHPTVIGIRGAVQQRDPRSLLRILERMAVPSSGQTRQLFRTDPPPSASMPRPDWSPRSRSLALDTALDSALLLNRKPRRWRGRTLRRRIGHRCRPTGLVRPKLSRRPVVWHFGLIEWLLVAHHRCLRRPTLIRCQQRRLERAVSTRRWRRTRSLSSRTCSCAYC